MLAIDVETHLLHAEGKVRSERQVPDMVCVAWARNVEWTGFEALYGTPEDRGLIMWDEPLAGRRLRKLIGDQTVVMHNAKFDLAVLSKWRPDLEPYFKRLVDEGRVLDTMCMYALRYPLKDRPRSLAQVVKHLFREDMEKGAVRTSFRRDTPITQAQRDYAIQDVVWTLKAARRLQEIPLGGLAREDDEFEVPSEPLYNGPSPDVLYSSASAYLAWFLEPEGLKVNLDAVDERYKELERGESRLSIALYEAGLARAERTPGAPVSAVSHRFTQDRRWTIACKDPLVMHRQWKGDVQEIPGKWILNTRELQAAFVAAAPEGLDLPQTPGGGISLEYDFWKEYAEALPKELQDYLALSKVRKYRSAFVGPLYHQRPERVFPHYAILGAETGRWACYRPNIQQQPKRLRSMYGYEMVGADYKSLECFTLAQAMAALGIRGPMLEALAQEDIHSFVAEKVGVTRQEAKIATFGLGGGMGNKRFFKYMRYQCGLDVTEDKAASVRRAWLRHFTDVQQYLDLFRRNPFGLCPKGQWRAWLTELGFDTNDTWPSKFEVSKRLGGKLTCVLPSGRVIPRRTFSQAANCFFQGIGADVMTLAFVRMCQVRVRTCAVVHDSAYVAAAGQAEALAGCMDSAIRDVCTEVQAPAVEWSTGKTFF